MSSDSNVWTLNDALEEVRRQSDLIQELAARESMLRALVETWRQRAQAVHAESPAAAEQLNKCADRLEDTLLDPHVFVAREA